tara:strand:+ start:4464 stop:7217 length:2754 start_codon:yes stop_codon:yes gene_type:complete
MNEKITNSDLFQSIFESSLAGLIVVDQNGFILTANKSAEQMFIYVEGELLQQDIHLIIPDWKINALAAEMNEIVVGPNQFYGREKTGVKFPIDIRIVPTVLKGQSLKVIYCKRADNPVFESDRKFRTLVTNVAGIVYSCSIAKPWSMEFISEASKTISGYAPDQFYVNSKLNWGNLIHPEDLPQVESELDRAVMEKGSYQLRYRIITSKKEIKWIWEHGSCIMDENNIPYRREGFMQDYTELKTAEHALVMEKKLLRQYMDTSPSMFLVINKDHTVQLVNKRTSEILGIEQDAILNKNWFKEFIPKRKQNQLIQLFESIFEDKLDLPNFHENPIVAKGGQEHLIQWSNAALRNGNNEIIAVVSSGLDITENKLTQETLKIRNRALEAVGNGIIIVDAQHPDLPIIYSNKAFTRITGYGADEVLGRNCRFLQNGDRNQPEIAFMSKAIGHGSSCRVLIRNYSKDGILFWNDLFITPLYDQDQKLTHFIGVLNDVTEIQDAKRKLEEYAQVLEDKVEERTREVQTTVEKLVSTNLNLEDQMIETQRAQRKANLSRALFTAIAHNFPNGVIMVFNSDYELVYVEGEEMDRINIKKSDFEGIPIDDIPVFSKIQIKKIKSDIRKTLRGGNISFEVDFHDQCYAVNSTPLYSDEKKIMWALFVYNNVTEQKEVQHKLERTIMVEKELNELKSRFITIASHEFRTPLSAILSSAILIGKQNEPGKEDRRMKHVSRIRTNVRDLVVILNDFLSLSKLEEGKVSVKPQFFELIQFLKMLVDEMEPNKKEGQDIVLKYSQPSISVCLDPKLLNHIIINLLSNAIKYSMEGQIIGLEVDANDKELFIHVKDQGIGIPKANQKKLFERFYRAENATNFQGTGLGLNIVKQYTGLLSGTVGFKSKLGKGSTFSLKLPININEYEKDSIN